MSSDVKVKITKIIISTGLRSDHSLVKFYININVHERRPGNVNLNNSFYLLVEKIQLDITKGVSEIVNVTSNANPIHY